MSKVIAATCVGGIVTADGVPVPSAEILTAGVAQSSGVLILDADKAYYLGITYTDLETTLTKLSAAVGQIANTLTSIGAGMTGPTTAPPVSLPTDVATLNGIKAEVDLLKESLK